MIPKDPAPKFKLTKQEINSAVWIRLMEYFEDRLTQLRAENDADRNEIDTAKHRGRIAELKAWKSLDNLYE